MPPERPGFVTRALTNAARHSFDGEPPHASWMTSSGSAPRSRSSYDLVRLPEVLYKPAVPSHTQLAAATLQD